MSTVGKRETVRKRENGRRTMVVFGAFLAAVAIAAATFLVVKHRQTGAEVSTPPASQDETAAPPAMAVAPSSASVAPTHKPKPAAVSAAAADSIIAADEAGAAAPGDSDTSSAPPLSAEERTLAAEVGDSRRVEPAANTLQ